MTVNELEVAACAGEEMPGNLNSAEQLLFQKLRYLYANHRAGVIDRERGRREKAKIMECFQSDTNLLQRQQEHMKSEHLGKIVKHNGAEYLFSAVVLRENGHYSAELRELKANSAIVVNLERVEFD